MGNSYKLKRLKYEKWNVEGLSDKSKSSFDSTQAGSCCTLCCSYNGKIHTLPRF